MTDENPRCPHGCGPLRWVDDQWCCPTCGDEWGDEVADLPVQLTRRFQMVRVRTGDWLLPANNRETVWRLVKDDDGWCVYRWRNPVDTIVTRFDIDDGWEDWDLVTSHRRTRDAAIQYALGHA